MFSLSCPFPPLSNLSKTFSLVPGLSGLIRIQLWHYIHWASSRRWLNDYLLCVHRRNDRWERLHRTRHHEDGTSAEEAIATGQQREQEAKAGDAFARGSADGLTWTVSTKLVEMTFDGSNGGFRLVSFLNKQTDPAVEYVDPNRRHALCFGF